MKTCIIFDLDGTLIDSAADLASAVNLTRGTRGLSALPVKQVAGFAGEGPRSLLERSFFDAPETDIDALLPVYKEFYRLHQLDQTRLYPGVKEGLRQLKAAGIPLAVVTNKHHDAVTALLDHFGITGCFQSLLGSGMGFEPKPAPDALLHFLAECGAVPGESWMLGDHFTDLEAGRRAGMKRAYAAWGFGDPRRETWDFRAENFAEFVNHSIGVKS